MYLWTVICKLVRRFENLFWGQEVSGLPHIFFSRLWRGIFALFVVVLLATAGPVQSRPVISENQRILWDTAKKHMIEGAPRAALPLLEQLVTLAPEQAVFRLELAYALFQIADDERANYHLVLARGASLSPSELGITEALLARIRDRKNWTASYHLNVVPQSNIGQGTYHRTITIGGLDFIPTPPKGGVVLGLGGSFTYLPKLGRDMRARFMVAGDFKVSKTRAFRDYTVRSEAGILWQKDHGLQFGFGASYEIRRVADRAYSQSSGLYLSYGSRIGTAGTLAIRAAYFQRAYAINPLKDGPIGQLVVSYSHVVSPAFLLRASGVIARTKAAAAQHSGTNVVLSVGGQYAFTGGIVANIDVTFGVERRDGIHRLFGVARQDRRRSIDLKLHKRDLRIGKFVPQISIGYTDVQSTLPINSYNNSYMSIQLSRQF